MKCHVVEMDDLGPISFNNHIATICRKALAHLIRNLYHCKFEIRRQAYFLYVGPILEYASAVWVLHTKINIDKIKQHAARFVVSDHSNVTGILSRLKDN